MAQVRGFGPHLLAVYVLLLGVLWSGLGGVPASASCATDNPPRSPAAFRGVVAATTSKGRVATVVTDAGRTVQVVGTPAGTSSAETSVDRHYEVGGRYEFHPLNRASPYEDNTCTATRLLVRGPTPPAPATPGQSPVSGQSSAAERQSPAQRLLVAGVGVAGVVTALLAWRRARRLR